MKNQPLKFIRTHTKRNRSSCTSFLQGYKEDTCFVVSGKMGEGTRNIFFSYQFSTLPRSSTLLSLTLSTLWNYIPFS